MVSWVERQHRKDDKYKKKKSRLKTDKTNVYILRRGGWGGNSALDLALQLPLSPVALPNSMEGRSEHPRGRNLHKPRWATSEARPFHPCTEATHPGSAGRCRTQKKYPPSEVCSGCLVPAKVGCLSQILGGSERGKPLQLLAQKEWELSG